MAEYFVALQSFVQAFRTDQLLNGFELVDDRAEEVGRGGCAWEGREADFGWHGRGSGEAVAGRGE